MVIADKYELLSLKAEDTEARTFNGRELPTGRTVLVHQVLQPSLLQLARRSRPRAGLLIEIISNEGIDYVVTQGREEPGSLRSWLEEEAGSPLPLESKSQGEERFTRVGAWRVPGEPLSKPATPESASSSASGIFASSPPPAPQSAAPSGEFTRMFAPPAAAPAVNPELPTPPEPGSSENPAATITVAMPGGSPAPEPPRFSPPASNEAGEFTRMFQATTPAPASPAGSPSGAAQPGEFTRMFQAPTPTATPSVHPPRAAPAEPGEFTRYFQSPLTSRPLDVNQPPAAPPAPAAPQPGEYTRLFQMPAPSSLPVSGGGATQVYATPSAGPVPSTQPEAGPSEFTRIIQSSPSPPPEVKAPQPPAPAPARSAPSKPKTPLALILILASLAVLAIVLVLIVALRH